EADSWEIIEGLKIGQSNVQRPDKHEGFMLKKRKWPLKGWHKRFFVLDNGILKYSKSPIDIQKGKLHGSIDVGLSVMSIKKRARRIDLDTEEHIYHLKVKSQEIFDAWVSKLRHHRLYRQNEIVRSPRDATMRTFPPPAAMDSPQPAASVVHEAK
ncbi:oxysterol-binding protein-related protein 6-like, partial [Seriola lalandi dorsalis]